jgi:hypothetical protein
MFNENDSSKIIHCNGVTFLIPGIFNVCIFCRPVKERRRILDQNMKEVPNRIMFSEMKEMHVSA